MKFWSDLEEGEDWNPLFTRLFNDWEVEDAKKLRFKVTWVVLAYEFEDRLCWMMTKDGVFSIKSIYKALQLALNVSFP